MAKGDPSSPVCVCVCVAGRQWQGQLGSEMFIYSFFDHCVACRTLVLPPGIEPLTSAMTAWILFFFFNVLYFLLNYSSRFFCSFVLLLILAALGLHCCTQTFSSCSEGTAVCCAGCSPWWPLSLQSAGSRHPGSLGVACRL